MESEKKVKGEITKTRALKAIDLLCDEIKSSKEDFLLIADIISLISQQEYMSAIRAAYILEDAKRIIPYIAELILL